MQSGLHGLQSLLVVGEAMCQADVCEQQGLLVFRDVVHDRQRLHYLRRTFRDLSAHQRKARSKSSRVGSIKGIKASSTTRGRNRSSPYRVVRCGCSVECCC